MPELDELSLRVLRLLSARPSGSGFEMLTVEGEPHDVVSTIVERLRFDHLIEAAVIPLGLGSTPHGCAPSTLTDKGRRVLASLDGVVCPTCFQPMRALEHAARPSVAIADGRLFECPAHGEWYLAANTASLKRLADPAE